MILLQNQNIMLYDLCLIPITKLYHVIITDWVLWLYCVEQEASMAQVLAPSTQWQMRITKNSPRASPITSNMWSSFLLRQNKKTSPKFRVLAIKSESGTVNRIEKLLNLDVTPYTDKIIAEYIWYFIPLCLLLLHSLQS